MQVEYFFDVSSPWTFLSFGEVQRVCARQNATLVWKPILVGGVFNTVNPTVYEGRANPVAVKSAYYAKDMQDWARLRGIVIGSPPVFPVNSVKAMRGAFVALDAGLIEEYCERLFTAYWTDLLDISQDEVLAPIVERAGLGAAEFFEEISGDRRKQQLRDVTDELIARGGYGSPTLFLDQSDMYFGNDRLALMEARMQSQNGS
jgi:2-hydroxychromene-2-carboxylate isomerase